MSTGKPAALRVVLDSNIYVSALVFTTGHMSTLWARASRQDFTTVASPQIISEVADVLRARFGWDRTRTSRAIKRLSRVAELVVPKERIYGIEDDPDDNCILECAVAGHADLIVSGDRHLRDLKSFRRIPIVGPTDLLRMLGPP